MGALTGVSRAEDRDRQTARQTYLEDLGGTDKTGQSRGQCGGKDTGVDERLEGGRDAHDLQHIVSNTVV